MKECEDLIDDVLDAVDGKFETSARDWFKQDVGSLFRVAVYDKGRPWDGDDRKNVRAALINMVSEAWRLSRTGRIDRALAMKVFDDLRCKQTGAVLDVWCN